MASGCRSTRTPFHVGTPASVVSAEASWPVSCSARASSPRYLHGCSFRESGGRVSVVAVSLKKKKAEPGREETNIKTTMGANKKKQKEVAVSSDSGARANTHAEHAWSVRCDGGLYE